MEQNAESKPIWPKSLDNFTTFKTADLDPHRLFSHAALSSLAHSGVDIGDSIIPSGFELPTCVSNKMILQDIDKVNEKNQRSWFNPMRYAETWFLHHRAFFPFRCGDWKASETRNFLDGMPIGPSHTNAQGDTLQDFYDHSLRYDIIYDYDSPITHFLTLCEAGWRSPEQLVGSSEFIPLPNGHEYEKGAHPLCAQLKEEIKDMGEIEANNWFCHGPSMEDALKKEAHQLKPDLRINHKRPTHGEMCGLEWSIEFPKSDNHNPDYFRGKYPASWDHYRSKIEHYKTYASKPYSWKVSFSVILHRNPNPNSCLFLKKNRKY